MMTKIYHLMFNPNRPTDRRNHFHNSAQAMRTVAVIVFHFLHYAVRDISDNDVKIICLNAAHDTDETERQPLA